MQQKHYAKAFVDEVDKEGMISVAVGSTSVIDREGDSISQEGWILDNFEKNAPLLWAHNMREMRPPIGIITRTWFDEGGEGNSNRLMFSAKFDLEDEFAKMIHNKYEKGFLNAFSVGFIPHEKEGDTFTKQELIEISAVPVPANPQALVELKGLNATEDWDEAVGQKDSEPKEETENEEISVEDIDPKLLEAARALTSKPKEEPEEEPEVEEELPVEEVKPVKVITQPKRQFTMENMLQVMKVLDRAVNIAFKKNSKGGDK